MPTKKPSVAIDLAPEPVKVLPDQCEHLPGCVAAPYHDLACPVAIAEARRLEAIESTATEEGAGDRALAIAQGMPPITSVSVTFGRTQNTGNFSGLRYDVTYAATIPAGADPSVVEAYLAGRAKRDVQAHIWADKDTYANDWPASPR